MIMRQLKRSSVSSRLKRSASPDRWALQNTNQDNQSCHASQLLRSEADACITTSELCSYCVHLNHSTAAYDPITGMPGSKLPMAALTTNPVLGAACFPCVQVNYSFNNGWAGLLNKCLESREPQFTYKFCFFDKATQIDNGGGHETNLGFWKGFEKGGTEVGLTSRQHCTSCLFQVV